jgi:membrane protease YdiL (CAAX protease family)
MRITQELKIFVFYLFLIVIAETVTSFINPSYGLFIHSMLLVSLFTLSAFWHKTKNASNLFLCLSIAPLIRIFSLSLPLQYFPTYAWYLVAAIPMLMAAITVIRLQGLSLTDVGITFKKPIIQLTVMLTGIPFGILEYFILKPNPLAVSLSTINFILLAIGFIIATGFVEELVFRGVFLNNAVKVLGGKIGLISVTAVFAALHIGWLSIFDVIFVFTIGLFFGVLTLKTGSIAGVSLSHGLTNVFLFLVMPSINLISLMSPK